MDGCGGALIAPDLVLFAAHCRDWKNKQINVGAYERQTNAHGSRPRFCEEWKADPTFGAGGSQLNNDFALCKLDRPVYDIDTSFVRLELNGLNSNNGNAEQVTLNIGEELIVMGLGKLAQTGNGPQFLHNVTVPVISNNDCNQRGSYNGAITDVMLCAGYPEGQRDSCQGDSGGPLIKRVYQNGNKESTFVDYHVGVVSWGQGCALPNKPGVYARTSSATDFIKNTACNEFNSVASFCDYNNDNAPAPQPEACLEAELGVRVTTDIYGMETSWTLRGNDNNENDHHNDVDNRGRNGNVNEYTNVISATVPLPPVIKERKYSIKFNKNEHSVCLRKQHCYVFKIMDSYGDGMCTDAGCGSYDLTLAGITFFSGNGDFTNTEVKEFCIDADGKPVGELDNDNNPEEAPPSPTLPPITVSPPTGRCNGKKDLRFQLQLKIDDYGEETTWIMSEIVDLESFDPETITAETGEVYAAETDPTVYKAFGTYTLPADNNEGNNNHDFYCLQQDACYLFQIYDQYWDGLVGGASHGYYKGFLASEPEEPIFRGAAFGGHDFRVFCTGTASLGAPSCVDAKNAKIDGRKRKSCAWAGLPETRKRRKRRCNKIHNGERVFDICPNTCGKRAGLGQCSYLYQKE